MQTRSDLHRLDLHRVDLHIIDVYRVDLGRSAHTRSDRLDVNNSPT